MSMPPVSATAAESLVAAAEPDPEVLDGVEPVVPVAPLELPEPPVEEGEAVSDAVPLLEPELEPDL